MKMMLMAFVVLILFDCPLYSMNEDGDWKQNWSSDSNLSDMSSLSNIINRNNDDASLIFSDSNVPMSNDFDQSTFQLTGGGSDEEIPESTWSFGSLYQLLPISITGNTVLDPFEGLLADEYLGNYHELYEYLQKYVDIPDKNAHAWIANRAKIKGDVVCLYLSVRNHLKYYTECSQECFMMILLLLMRVAYDSVNHYALFKDPSVLGPTGAYYMLKQKIHWMLGYYMPKISVALFPPIATITTSAFEHWEKYFNKNQRLFPCVWLRSFQWAHAWTPKSWGIVFGPNSTADIDIFETTKSSLVTIDTFAIIKNIFTCKRGSVFDLMDENFTPNRYNTWTEFFQSFDFPLTIEEITQKIKPSIYGDI